MFKRKDEDIDLLSEAGGSMTDNSKNEPKMSAASTESSSPSSGSTTSAAASVTPTTTTPTATTPAATPAAPATATPTSGYTRPNEASGVSRPTSFRPAGDTGRAGSDYRPAGSSLAGSSNSNDKSKSGRRVLTVGNDILLKGEIATCDRLVIEGAVDATLNEVHTVEIAETGSFKGTAEIEDAEISGIFDGELTVRGRLVIYSTGQVRGKITYGEIEIERGGEMTGMIKSYKGEASAAKKPDKKDKEKIKEAA